MADDVVASASVSVEPDLSNFGDMLQAALGPALSDAVASVSAATADMASQASANAASFGGAIEDAVIPAADAAASAVADAAGSMEGSFDAVSGAVETMGAATEVAAEESASALGDVVGAADDVVAGAGGAGDALERLGSDGGSQVSGLADLIKGVALGSLLADGIEGGVDIALESLQELITFIPEVGEAFHEATNQVRVATGATGDQLAGFEEELKGVYGRTPADLSTVANALTTVYQRLGLTGDGAEELSLTMIRLGRITGADVNGVIDSSTAIFNTFGTAVDDQTSQLDRFLRVSQATGIPVDSLMSSLQSSGLAFKAAGFSADEAASILGNLNRVGLSASAIQLALGRATANAAKDGIPARQAFDNLFTSIADAPTQMAATSAAVEAFGQRAGPRLAELIRSGQLSYADLTAQIEAGGDTIEQAVAATGTWHSALTILSHTIQNAVEPVASKVFHGLNQAVRTTAPVVGELVSSIGDRLTPIFLGLMHVLTPVWEAMDDVRDAFSKAVAGFKLGLDPLSAIQVFFNNIFNDADKGRAIVDVIRDVGDALADVWTFLEPVRSTIGDIFSTIGDAISTFVDANPEAVLAGVSAALLALGGPVVIAGLSAVAGLIATIATSLAAAAISAAAAAAPFVAIALAVAGLVAGVKYAYENFDGFREAVDKVADVIQSGLMVAFEDVQAWIDTNLLPTIDFLSGKFDALWAAIDNFDSGNLLGSLSEVAGALGGVLAGLLADLPNQVLILVQTLSNELLTQLAALPIVGDLIGVIQQWFNLAVGALGNIFDFFGGFLTLDAGRMQNAAMTLGDTLWMAIRDAIPATLSALGDLAVMLIAALGPPLADLGGLIAEKVMEGVQALPGVLASALSGIAAATGVVFGEWLPEALSSASDLLADGLAVAFDFLADLPSIVGRLIVQYGPTVGKVIIGGILFGMKLALYDLPKWVIEEAIPALIGAIIDHGPGVLRAFGDMLGKIPGLLGSVLGDLGEILGAILSGLGGVILSWGVDLGHLLLTALTNAFNWIVTSGPGILEAVGNWFMGLPMVMLGWLGDLGSVLLGWLGSAFDFMVANSLSVLSQLVSWAIDIPVRIILWLGTSLGPKLVEWASAAFGWIVDHGPEILAAVVGWFVGIPAMLIEGVKVIGTLLVDWMKNGWGFVVTSGPDILLGILTWLASLPGLMLDSLGALGSKLVGWLTTAFDYVVTQGPTMLEGMLDWFAGLPGKIFDAIVSGLSAAGGAAMNIAATIYNAIVDFINEHLILPIRDFPVTVLGHDYHPFGSLPTLDPVALAKGGILDEPTLAVIGEAGREAAVPLDDEAQGVRVARAAGIDDMLARADGTSAGATFVQVQVEVTVESNDDPEEVGAAIGRGLMPTLRPLVRGA